MANKLKKASLLIFLLLGSLALYGAIVIVQARQQTERDVKPRLAQPIANAPTLSAEQQKILLMVEDPGFFEHHGVDLTTPGAGYTTITQNLVNRLYFERFQPGVLSKIRQTLIARFALDPMVNKADQLKAFLSLAYFGESEKGPVIGFTAAAQEYFNKPIAELQQQEFISLVALLIAPKDFNPRRHPERLAERVQRIQALLNGQYQPKQVSDLYYDRI